MVDHVSGILKRTSPLVVLAIAGFALCAFAPVVSAESVEEGPLKRNDLGLSWGRPSEEFLGPGLNDQYTAEVFYRLELLRVVTLTPDVQLLVDPALNPNEDVIAIFGVRGRVSF